MSGITKSIPSISSSGKAKPQSTIIISFSYSNTVIFFPISCKPPNGIIFKLLGLNLKSSCFAVPFFVFLVFAFQNHENRIQRNEDSIEELRNQVQKLEERDQKRSKDVELLLSEVRRLQKENSQLKNGEIPEVFEM